MAYDEAFAERIRDAIKAQPGLDEKKMFGGIGYLINGNMACGIWQDSLVVRVRPGNYNDVPGPAAHHPVRCDRTRNEGLDPGRPRGNRRRRRPRCLGPNRRRFRAVAAAEVD